MAALISFFVPSRLESQRHRMVYNYLLGSSQPPGNCFESVMDVWSKEDEKFKKKIYGQDVPQCVCVCLSVCVFMIPLA